VRDEGVTAVIISGDEVTVPLLKEYLPKELSDKVVDVAHLGVNTPEREVLDTTLEMMRQKDAETDRARVEALLGAYRADGLGVVGVDATLRALEMGQVDELVISADPETIDAGNLETAQGPAKPSAEERAADRLVVKARQTAAKIRFIEEASLLAAVGGAGAFLRFKL
jgi:peptide subunit release factor 1 (eRF1)